MTIICATDFSTCSRTATRLGAALARRTGDTLLLLHVLEPLPVDPLGAGISLADWQDLGLGRCRAGTTVATTSGQP